MTVGGTTSGYSLMGSCVSEIAPTRKMMIERTPAKIGRLMKKSEIFMGKAVARGRVWQLGCSPPHQRRDGIRVSGSGARAQGRGLSSVGEFQRLVRLRCIGRETLRRDGHAGAHALEAVDDDLIAGV